jgi:hypothetical protein
MIQILKDSYDFGTAVVQAVVGQAGGESLLDGPEGPGREGHRGRLPPSSRY